MNTFTSIIGIWSYTKKVGGEGWLNNTQNASKDTVD